MGENPLWEVIKLKGVIKLKEVIKLKDGKETLSYKSNNVLYLLRCKQYGNEVEKPGNTIGQCTRCKYTLRYDDDERFVKEAPTDEKDIRVAVENMKKPTKQLTSIEDAVPDKRKKEKTKIDLDLTDDESDDSNGSDVDVIDNSRVGLDIKDLVKLASSSSGLRSKTQLDFRKRKKILIPNAAKKRWTNTRKKKKWKSKISMNSIKMMS
jgi:hypothetical protein